MTKHERELTRRLVRMTTLLDQALDVVKLVSADQKKLSQQVWDLHLHSAQQTEEIESLRKEVARKEYVIAGYQNGRLRRRGA